MKTCQAFLFAITLSPRCNNRDIELGPLPHNNKKEGMIRSSSTPSKDLKGFYILRDERGSMRTPFAICYGANSRRDSCHLWVRNDYLSTTWLKLRHAKVLRSRFWESHRALGRWIHESVLKMGALGCQYRCQSVYPFQRMESKGAMVTELIIYYF